MEKENVTTDLVSLRSGLSLISKYTDEIRKEEQNRSQVNKKIEHIKKEKVEAEKNQSCSTTSASIWRNNAKTQNMITKIENSDLKVLMRIHF